MHVCCSHEAPGDPATSLRRTTALGYFRGRSRAEGVCGSTHGVGQNKELFLSLGGPRAAIHRHDSLAAERCQTKHGSAEKR